MKNIICCDDDFQLNFEVTTQLIFLFDVKTYE
jgi:hypothetical protein